MKTHKRLLIADDYFYNKLNIPTKVSYIKKVAKSCRNCDELSSVEKWGYKVLYDAFVLFTRNISDEHYFVSDVVNITNKFSNNFDAWQDDMTDTFERLIEKFELGNESLSDEMALDNLEACVMDYPV